MNNSRPESKSLKNLKYIIVYCTKLSSVNVIKSYSYLYKFYTKGI